MNRSKSEGVKSPGGEDKKWEDRRRERERGKKMQVHEKVGKSRFTVFFPMICGSGGSKSRLAKAAGAEPFGQMRDEKLHPVVARSTFWNKKCKSTTRSEHFLKLRCRKSSRRCGAAHFQVKMYKAHHSRTTFGSWDVEKVHAVVARSTFPSQNVQSTPFPDHFWTFRCRKSTRFCGAKHVWKSKVSKTEGFEPFWRSDVEKVRTNKLNWLNLT